MKNEGSETICAVISLLGIMLLFGTAGACDLGQISVRQAVIQSSVGVLLFIGGAYWGGVLS